MQIKQLTAFHAVASCQSFSEATASTGLSQPTLSRLIKQLESDMGVELIDRYHRPLKLTKAGGFFFDKSQHILSELDTITHITKRIATPHTGLNIGFVPSVLYGLLPEIIAKLKAYQPTLSIELKDISSYQQIDALNSGEIDVGFGRFSYSNNSNHTWIRQILLRHERYVVALPKAHRLANTADQHLRQLADNRLILYHQSQLSINQPLFNQPSSISEPLLYLFAKQGVEPYQTTTVSDLQVALGLVAAGEGITLVPASLQSMRTEQVSYQRLIHENATSPIYLNFLTDAPHPQLASLLQVIYQIYEQRGITYRKAAL